MQWVLIVIISGTTPPTGVAIEGFASKQACEDEARSWCEPGVRIYRCACRPSPPIAP